MDLYLVHHGIKGQKWGVRRYQNADGSYTSAGKKRYSTANFQEKSGVIKRGTPLYRVAITRDDPTFANRKYFSTNEEDHDAWKDDFRKYTVYNYKSGNSKRSKSYDTKYIAIRDIKIASAKEAGEITNKYLDALSPDNTKKLIADIKNNPGVYMRNDKGKLFNKGKDYAGSIVGTVGVARNSNIGKVLIKDLKSRGYSGVYDSNGTDVGKNPIIIFNPDSKVMRTKVRSIKYDEIEKMKKQARKQKTKDNIEKSKKFYTGFILRQAQQAQQQLFQQQARQANATMNWTMNPSAGFNM